MSELRFDRNRQLLAKVPLVQRADGAWPVARDGDRRARHVAFGKDGRLRRYIAKDGLLKDFVALPSKDNGLDVEGLAARGDRVWLGLRGPVLRGHAVVLEMQMDDRGKHGMKPRRIDGRLRFRKHLLPLGGDGIRDMAVSGDDLILLAGTPLANDGRSAILRWRGGTRQVRSGVRPASDIVTARALPYRGTTDNPEGLCDLGDGRWLVLHDSPDCHRLGDDPPRLVGDVWTLRPDRA